MSSFIIKFQLDNSGLLGGVSFNVLKIQERILALICDKTPRYYSVYLRTSLSSLMEAILNINVQIIITLTQQVILQSLQHSMAQHSAYNKQFKGRIACGLPVLPFKTKIDGPGNVPFDLINNKDIIDQAFEYFRINVLFKNFQIDGPADKLLIYLLVLISYLFKSVQNVKQVTQAEKRLSQVASSKIPLPKDKANFISMILTDGNGQQRQVYMGYIKQIRAETIKRFLQKFFQNGVITQDFKFWAGLAKKKFMGINYASMF